MDLIQVIVLALIQGITEFLPISSSAHLILPHKILGWGDQGLAFDVAVHVGSLAAVLYYYRQDVGKMLVGWLNSCCGQHSSDGRLAWLVIVATIPAGLAGLLGNDYIEANFRSVTVIASTTLIFGLALAASEYWGSREKHLLQLGVWSAVIIGCAQALALIPGTSRSGITITAALLLGFSRLEAARFSFLLSMPIILLSGGYKGMQLLELSSTQSIDWQALIAGTVLSALSAYTCITLFLNVINRIGMMPFVIYRLGLAAVLFIFFA